MNKRTSLSLAGIAAAALFAGQAFATVCPNAPATGTPTQSGPICIAPVGQDGAGTGLQDQLNGITVSGPGIDVYNDQYQPSSWWSIGATGNSENKIVLEIAGNASVNTFGIFDPTNASNHLQLFGGGASAGWSTQLANLGGGNYMVTNYNAAGIYQGQTSATFGVTNLFGYYLDTPDGTFYSVPGMNPNSNATYPGGVPHMVAYAGDGSTKLNIHGVAGKFLPNEFLLAWEDTLWANSDLDYNDFVVIVESVDPIPEPAALGMFGFGVLLLGVIVGLRRRDAHNVV